MLPGLLIPTPDPAPRVLLFIGLPGSGKSTYAQQHHLPVLSSDAIRLLLSDDENNQQIHGRVFDSLRYLLRHRLELRRPITAIDATNLKREHRLPFLQLAASLGATTEALWFDLPLDTCLLRNSLRSRQVPQEAIRAMAASLEPPSPDEGFALIHRITS